MSVTPALTRQPLSASLGLEGIKVLRQQEGEGASLSSCSTDRLTFALPCANLQSCSTSPKDSNS